MPEPRPGLFRRVSNALSHNKVARGMARLGLVATIAGTGTAALTQNAGAKTLEYADGVRSTDVYDPAGYQSTFGTVTGEGGNFIVSAAVPPEGIQNAVAITPPKVEFPAPGSTEQKPVTVPGPAAQPVPAVPAAAAVPKPSPEFKPKPGQEIAPKQSLDRLHDDVMNDKDLNKYFSITYEATDGLYTFTINSKYPDSMDRLTAYLHSIGISSPDAVPNSRPFHPNGK